MNTVLFVNATIGFSENLFLVIFIIIIIFSETNKPYVIFLQYVWIFVLTWETALVPMQYCAKSVPNQITRNS